VRTKWAMLQSLDPASAYNAQLVRNVEGSILMCQEYQTRTEAGKLCQQITDAIRGVRQSMANTARQIAEVKFSWENFLNCFYIAAKTIGWVVAAPVLALTDAVYHTDHFHRYNESIRNAFSESPWTMAFMMVALVGGIAAGGYYLAIPAAVASLVPAAHAAGLILVGGAAAAGYGIRGMQLSIAHDSDARRLQQLTNEEQEVVRKYRASQLPIDHDAMMKENIEAANSFDAYWRETRRPQAAFPPPAAAAAAAPSQSDQFVAQMLAATEQDLGHMQQLSQDLQARVNQSNSNLAAMQREAAENAASYDSLLESMGPFWRRSSS
jgi:hypothetical protein